MGSGICYGLRQKQEKVRITFFGLEVGGTARDDSAALGESLPNVFSLPAQRVSELLGVEGVGGDLLP